MSGKLDKDRESIDKKIEKELNKLLKTSPLGGKKTGKRKGSQKTKKGR